MQPCCSLPVDHGAAPCCATPCRSYEHGQKYSAHWDVNDTPKRQEQMRQKGVLGGLRTATLLMYLSGEAALSSSWPVLWRAGAALRSSILPATGGVPAPPLLPPPPCTPALPPPSCADVEEGGETAFPHGRWLNRQAQASPPYTECASKGVAIKPRKGDAILFHSLKPGGGWPAAALSTFDFTHARRALGGGAAHLH